MTHDSRLRAQGISHGLWRMLLIQSWRLAAEEWAKAQTLKAQS